MNDKPVQWAGLNHLALITNDMDLTTRFWHGVIGAPLVATIGNAAFRHYFFDVGNDATVAFFEYRGHPVDQFAKPSGVPDERAIQFDHVSLNLPDQEALLALRQRLIEHDCEVTDVVDHGLLKSIYFTDPTGIALEASWWVDNPTGQAPQSDERRYADTNPVPAAKELRETGKISDLPATKLIDEPTGDVYDFVQR
ncbi:MAG: VOC family protein [bacterium]|nr:VOC family protein [bacterium]